MDFLNKYFNYENGSVTYGLTEELISFYVLNLLKKTKESVIVLTSTLFEANKIYNSIKTYTNNCSLFPMDDFLSSVALAISPEFKMTRIDTLKKIKESKQIVITNLMGYLRYLPAKDVKDDISINIGDEINRDELVNKLIEFGYNKESLVTSTGEFAIRGYIIDIFPFFEEHPIRIELFGNTIESLRYYNEETQLSNKSIKKISIHAIDEIKTDSYNSLVDYLPSSPVVFINKDQIEVSYQNLQEEIFNYNTAKNQNEKYMFDMEEINPQFTLLIDNINRMDTLQVGDIPPFNEDYQLLKKNYDKWMEEKKDVIFYLPHKREDEIVRKIIPTAKIVNKKINKGFYIDTYVIISDYDIEKNVEEKINHNLKLKYGKKIKSYNDLERGDYVVHISHGIGIYNGIVTLTKDGITKDYVQILYDGNDKIYIPVEKINTIYKYSDKDGLKPKLNKLNSTSWLKTRNYIQKKAKDISEELLRLYAERANTKGKSYQNFELEEIFNSQFEYEETKDQLNAIKEINNDLNSSIPMDRLLCGDVGFGKTEVANRAIYKTVLNNEQVMYLCPTTILSKQQFNVIKNRFKNEAVEIRLLNRFTTPKETLNIKEDLKNGQIDIIVGTHRLLSGDINFKSLGLLIVDEEQRFGVSHKEKIKKMKTDVNVLTLSATPIPRTLKMALSGLRDMSVIETPPINRYPVQTYVIGQNDLIIKDAIYKELSRDGQIYLLYNKVASINEMRDYIHTLVPEAKIGVAHGQMNKSELDSVMNDFINHNYDILLCTTIIESGIDIPNANTLIVIDADNFGLSQLYQIRGRVGRSNKIAYAYLFYDNRKPLNEIAVKRLQAIKEFTELGSGYKIAMRDLAIRGAGDVFGSDQAGFVDPVGISLYMKLIEDEIKKTKGEYVEEDEDDQNLIQVSTHIKDDYVSDEDIKVMIHQKINEIDSYEKLLLVKNELIDRFGKIDNDLEIYMYEEWFSNLAKMLDIEKVNQTDRYIEIVLSKEQSENIDGEKLFLQLYKISDKFNIKNSLNRIVITLYIKNLEKHYIYYLVDLMNLLKNCLKRAKCN